MTHYITLSSNMIAGHRGEVVPNLICTAAPGADCRKRPADPDREEWSLDDPDLIDGECWAVEWAAEGGWETVATDHAEIGRIPVAVQYDEGVLVAPAEEEPPGPRIVRHRDAITGEYVTADEAAARPDTTVRETRKP